MPKFYNFEVGTTVGVVRADYRRSVAMQGFYKVTKCNGAVCEITREDGYVRTFSNRTGIEKTASSLATTAQLITVAEYEALAAQVSSAARIAGLWTDAQAAASRRDFTALESIMALLKSNGAV